MNFSPASVAARIALDLWRAERGGPAAIAARQRVRLASLVSFARQNSPFYQRRYSGLPPTLTELGQLPPVTKTELMASFDEWLTDREISLADVRRFLNDRSLIGSLYLSRYSVCMTSGATGVRGIFLEDPFARQLDFVAGLWRGTRRWLTPRTAPSLAKNGYRVACVMATGGHYASVGSTERNRRRSPWLASRLRPF